MGRFLYRAAAMFALAGCGLAPDSTPPPSGAPQKPCPAIGSSDWAAWINAMPGRDAQSTLIVSGKVTVPTGGYHFVWRDMRVMESHPVQVAIDLEVIPPSAGATQAVVTHEVRGQWPMSPPVGSVTVRCGGQTLAAISPVQTAY